MNEPTEKAALALCEAIEIGEHPDAERELFAFVDGMADAALRREIEAHLDLCAYCRSTVADLRALVRPRRRPWLLLVAASMALIVISAIVLSRPPPPRTPSPPRIAQRAAPVPLPDPWESLADRVRAGAPAGRPGVLREIREEEDVLRGTPPSHDGLTPAGVVVKTARPDFRWPAPAGATSLVQIFSGEDEVARSGTLATRQWRPRQELRRGVTYAWQVRVTESGRTSSQMSSQIRILGVARFHVVDAATLAELDAAERAHPQDHLLLGILHARAGLDAEARAQLAQATGARDAAVARRILREIEAR